MKRPAATPWKSSQLMSGHSYEIHYYRDKDFKSVSMHSHDFYELYYFIGGAATYIIEGRRYCLKGGDILLIAPTNLHQLDISNSEAEYERIVLWLNPRYVRSLSTEKTDLASCFELCDREGSHLLRNAAISTVVQGELLKLLRPDAALPAGCGSKKARNGHRERAASFGCDIDAELAVKTVLLTLCRFLLSGHGRLPGTPLSSNSTVAAAMDYIPAHLDGDLTLDALASVLCVSKYYLIHVFKEETGTTPHQYILKKRLVYSKQLLERSLPITEVCSLCGFGDYSHYFRAFRREYGITPGRYAELIS